jgi:peroxin-5
MQFVRNLSVNAVQNKQAKRENTNTNGGEQKQQKQLETNLADSASTEDQTIESLKSEQASLSLDKDLATEWADEFNKSSSNVVANATVTAAEALLNNQLDDLYSNNFWSELHDEWNLAASENPNHPWLDEYQKIFDSYKSYEFDNDNPLRAHPTPFEEGLERLKLHDIVNAVLLFEVAVQKEPRNMLAWQYLGTTQVENEQDAQAIRALRRCLELKPDNLVALSTLATSYTNESMQRLAFENLLRWLKAHPDYSHLLKNDEQAIKLLKSIEDAQASPSPFSLSSMGVVHARDFIDLQEIFLKAVREKPDKIDPDLQCSLGVLFHLSGEYDKAADCFRTALQVKPNDHLLWNKLGATYANNNRNEEAIDAYFQALKLCPGFVRARYNLGIGCMNLGAYKEAVEHFLTALVQQSQANLPPLHAAESSSSKKAADLPISPLSIKVQQMSETIWNTLRLALSYLNRTDLYQSCVNKDLEHLKNEFNV